MFESGPMDLMFSYFLIFLALVALFFSGTELVVQFFVKGLRGNICLNLFSIFRANS